MILGDFNKCALLTGAGFSRNWEGLLASEFFGKLIGNAAISTYPEIRRLLLQETNFEVALHTVKTQGYPMDCVRAIEKAILDIFIEHDKALARTGFYHNADINIYGVQKFLCRFYGKTAGYLFTLNQDLLLERKFYNFDPLHVPRPTLPGIKPHEHWFTSIFGDAHPNGLPSDYIRIIESGLSTPKADWPPKLNGHFNYLKLHGSFDWRDKSGSELLIIGGGKAAAIDRSPILKWYSEVFQSVCMAGEVRLFISGYGFGDEHINAIIASGIKEARLRVFIHNTAGSYEMRKLLANLPCGDDIWSGLFGYSVRPLVEIFPGDQRRTQELASIESTLFG